METRREVAIAGRAALASGDLSAVVEALRAMPYERPSRRDIETCLAEWRGTCSTKHAVLAAVIARRWPELDARIVHRVYRTGHGAAFALYGPDVAATVPQSGVVDVHRFVTIAGVGGGERRLLDVTFAGSPWDGVSSMILACGDGDDLPAGSDPDADKLRLEQEHCDSAMREHFITALVQSARISADIDPEALTHAD